MATMLARTLLPKTNNSATVTPPALNIFRIVVFVFVP